MSNKVIDPYLYKNTNVLINKQNIRNIKDLESLEADLVPAAMYKLRKYGLEIKSVFDIQKIHQYLFDDIFEWAGEFRTITIYKKERIVGNMTVDYTPWDYIEKEMNDLEAKFVNINWDEYDGINKVKKVARIIQELWQIHCFREGNTRSVVWFSYFLLKTLGIHLNVEFIGKHSQYFRNSLVLASRYSKSEFEYLEGILLDATSFDSKDESIYKNIDGIEVEKYTYSYHTIEKLKRMVEEIK